MTEKPSHSRIRIAISQFLFAHHIELEDLYEAMGIEPQEADPGALAHLAGIIDGMTVASTRIRQHGLDDWAKGV